MFDEVIRRAHEDTIRTLGIEHLPTEIAVPNAMAFEKGIEAGQAEKARLMDPFSTTKKIPKIPNALDYLEDLPAYHSGRYFGLLNR